MEIKITKRVLLLHNNNDMVTNWYFLVHGRIVEGNQYRKFKFVVNFENWDILEFYEKEHYTKKDISNYLNECIFTFTDFIKSFNNYDYFYKLCDNSIASYNKLIDRITLLKFANLLF